MVIYYINNKALIPYQIVISDRLYLINAIAQVPLILPASAHSTQVVCKYKRAFQYGRYWKEIVLTRPSKRTTFDEDDQIVTFSCHNP